MNDIIFMGMLVGAVAVLMPLMIAVITPIVKLNKSIQKLNDSIDVINKEAEKKDKQIENHTLILNQYAQWLIIDKQRLDNQSMRLNKLDGQVGIEDKEIRK